MVVPEKSQILNNFGRDHGNFRGSRKPLPRNSASTADILTTMVKLRQSKGSQIQNNTVLSHWS